MHPYSLLKRQTLRVRVHSRPQGPLVPLSSQGKHHIIPGNLRVPLPHTPTCAPLSRLIVGSHAAASDQYIASTIRPAAEHVEVELRSTCGALEAAVNGSARSAPESHRADTRGRAQVDLLRGVAPTGASFDHVAAVLTALRCDHGHDHDTLSTSSLGLTVEASTKSPDEPTSASRAVHEPSKTMEARRQHEMTCGLAAGPARAERADE